MHGKKHEEPFYSSANMGHLKRRRTRAPKKNPSAYLEHVDARRGDDRLQRRVRLDNAAVVKLVLLDVHPDLLGYLRRFLVLEANLS